MDSATIDHAATEVDLAFHRAIRPAREAALAATFRSRDPATAQEIEVMLYEHDRLTVDLLESNFASPLLVLGYLSKEGVQYFLPALVRCAIEAYKNGNRGWLNGFIEYYLSPPYPSSHKKKPKRTETDKNHTVYFDIFIKDFSKSQLLALALLVRSVYESTEDEIEREPVKRALDLYWNRVS